jgi:succinate dehydrogenase flavin-adding protein (antitoxin of CptAB toxin-antitoxin module)
MKELDVLLERFIQANEEVLEQNAWPDLENLLQHEDDKLWDWLQDPGSADASRYQELLIRIRHDSSGAH